MINLQIPVDKTSSPATERMAPPVYDPYGPGTEHVYITQKAHRFRTRFSMPDKTDVIMQFEACRCVLSPEQAEVFDAILAKNDNLHNVVAKVDKEAALEAVRRHQAMMGAAGIKDKYSTAAITAMNAKMAQIDSVSIGDIAPENAEELARFADELAHGDMAITEYKPHAPYWLDKPA